MVAAALLDTRDIALRQHRQGGERNGPEDRFGETVGRPPRPNEIAAKRRELGPRDAGGVDAGESIGIARCRHRAMRNSGPNAIDDLAELVSSRQEIAAE